VSHVTLLVFECEIAKRLRLQCAIEALDRAALMSSFSEVWKCMLLHRRSAETARSEILWFCPSEAAAVYQNYLKCFSHMRARFGKQLLHPGFFQKHVDARQQITISVVVVRSVREIDKVRLVKIAHFL